VIIYKSVLLRAAYLRLKVAAFFFLSSLLIQQALLVTSFDSPLIKGDKEGVVAFSRLRQPPTPPFLRGNLIRAAFWKKLTVELSFSP
jgi:hypothetical protein